MSLGLTVKFLASGIVSFGIKTKEVFGSPDPTSEVVIKDGESKHRGLSASERGTGGTIRSPVECEVLGCGSFEALERVNVLCWELLRGVQCKMCFHSCQFDRECLLSTLLRNPNH